LECKNEPVAIRDALNIKLTQHHIIGDSAQWSFGYTQLKCKSSWSIISFNCQTDDIKWDKFNYFTLREQVLPAKCKTEKNKKDYKLKHSMMDDGDAKLREILPKPVYHELSKIPRIFLGAKYKAGVERKSDELMKRLKHML